MIKTIAVLTGGGDCPGLNAVIRGVVKTAIRHYEWNVLGIPDGFEGLIHKENIFKMGTKDIRGILPRGGTILGTSNRGNPFKFPVKNPDGSISIRDMSDTIVRNTLEMSIDGLIVIGGDGTLNIANALYKKGVNIVGVPKTIDNDLSATDYTFGFFTAVNTATDAIDKLHTTAESHHRIMIVEVMGRDAGWIALNSGIAGGADIILIPEIPYSIEKIMEKINERNAHGSNFSIIVIAEGAHEAGKDSSYIEKAKNEGVLPRHGGAGYYLSEGLSELTDMEIRTTVLGHVQRGGSPTAYDRILGSRFGAAAADLISNKQFGRMVSLSGKDIVSVSLEEAIARKHYINPSGQLIDTARKLQIELGD